MLHNIFSEIKEKNMKFSSEATEQKKKIHGIPAVMSNDIKSFQNDICHSYHLSFTESAIVKAKYAKQ